MECTCPIEPINYGQAWDLRNGLWCCTICGGTMHAEQSQAVDAEFRDAGLVTLTVIAKVYNDAANEPLPPVPPEHAGEVSRAPKRISVEEVSRRSGVPVALLADLRDSLNRMMNDQELRARIDAMYYAGNISDVKGFDWFLNADVPDVGE